MIEATVHSLVGRLGSFEDTLVGWIEGTSYILARWLDDDSHVGSVLRDGSQRLRCTLVVGNRRHALRMAVSAAGNRPCPLAELVVGCSERSQLQAPSMNDETNRLLKE
jgi:hypothetical protein